MTYTVTLPWMPKGLSPNDRMHWRKKAPITKAYKEACWALCKEAGLMLPVVGSDPMIKSSRYHIWLDFYPPNTAHRDDDNCIASFKAGRDGLALALGIDDRQFICHSMVWREVGGFVKVRITAGPES